MRNSNNPGKARVDLTDPYVSAGADVQRDSRKGTRFGTSSGAAESRTPRDLNAPSAELRSNAKLLAQKYADNDNGVGDDINMFMQAFKASPQGEQFFMPRYNMDNPQNA
tara:strand:+ start:685 stop:1011 length:327 start_codon:yes stop_codon:yes gene_type:complete